MKGNQLVQIHFQIQVGILTAKGQGVIEAVIANDIIIRVRRVYFSDRSVRRRKCDHTVRLTRHETIDPDIPILGGQSNVVPFFVGEGFDVYRTNRPIAGGRGHVHGDGTVLRRDVFQGNGIRFSDSHISGSRDRCNNLLHIRIEPNLSSCGDLEGRSDHRRVLVNRSGTTDNLVIPMLPNISDVVVVVVQLVGVMIAILELVHSIII